jgi:hypothetical protein
MQETQLSSSKKRELEILKEFEEFKAAKLNEKVKVPVEK